MANENRLITHHWGALPSVLANARAVVLFGSDLNQVELAYMADNAADAVHAIGRLLVLVGRLIEANTHSESVYRVEDAAISELAALLNTEMAGALSVLAGMGALFERESGYATGYNRGFDAGTAAAGQAPAPTPAAVADVHQQAKGV